MRKEKETFEEWSTPKQRRKPGTRANPSVEETRATVEKRRNPKSIHNTVSSPWGMKRTLVPAQECHPLVPDNDQHLQNKERGAQERNVRNKVGVREGERQMETREVMVEQNGCDEPDEVVQDGSPLQTPTPYRQDIGKNEW